MKQEVNPFGTIRLTVNPAEREVINEAMTNFEGWATTKVDHAHLVHKIETGEVLGVLFQEMSRYNKFDHPTNVSVGSSITRLREEIVAFSSYNSVDLNAVAKGEAELPDSLRTLFLSLHIQATKLVLGNWRLAVPHVTAKLGLDRKEDLEDTFQICLEHLYVAAIRWDPWHQINGEKTFNNARHFSSYAYSYLRRALEVGREESHLGSLRRSRDVTYDLVRRGQEEIGELSRYGLSGENVCAYVFLKEIRKIPIVTPDDIFNFKQEVSKDWKIRKAFKRARERYLGISNYENEGSISDKRRIFYRDDTGELTQAYEDLEESVSDPSVDIDELITNICLKEDIKEFLSKLDSTQRKVVELRFGLADGRIHTLEQVGQVIERHEETVRATLAKALRKLRHPTIKERLKDYL